MFQEFFVLLIGSNGFFVNLFFFQTFVDIVAKQLIYDRCCRDKKQHSRNTHQASADGYGYQNPDGRKSDGVSNHMRIDEGPFNLLKNQKHDQESNGSDWVDHQKKDPTAHPMKAPKIGIRAVKAISTPTSRA